MREAHAHAICHHLHEAKTCQCLQVESVGCGVWGLRVKNGSLRYIISLLLLLTSLLSVPSPAGVEGPELTRLRGLGA